MEMKWILLALYKEEMLESTVDLVRVHCIT